MASQTSGAPFTDWSTVPLVCDLATTAKVLNVSPRWIEDRLRDGVMMPAPMPRHRGKWQWSKKVLQSYVDGGYQQLHIAPRRRKAS